MESNQIFSLIDFQNINTFPLLWSSEPGGEAFVWDNYLLTFQVAPITIQEAMTQDSDSEEAYKAPLKHLYALTVYYQGDKSPYGPSEKPILAATIEVATFGLPPEKLMLMRALGLGSPMLCMYFPHQHANYGELEGDPDDLEECKKAMLKLVQKVLELKGEPESLGSLRNAIGLETGKITLREALLKKMQES